MIKRISIISFVLLIVVLFLYFIPPFLNYKIPYVEAKEFDLEIEKVENTYTRAELKEMVDELFGNPNYIYEEREELPFNAGGISYYYLIIPIIQVRADVSDVSYPMILAHELVHAVYYTASERFCNIKAFELLYNSGNDYLKYSALYNLKKWFNYELNGKIEYIDYFFAGNVKCYFI